MITMPAAYGVAELKSAGILTSKDLLQHFEEVKKLDPGLHMNWVFFSTSGTHGNYASLDDMDNDFDDPLPEECFNRLTVVVFKPRVVHTLYGQVTVEQEDIPALRQSAGG